MVAELQSVQCVRHGSVMDSNPSQTLTVVYTRLPVVNMLSNLCSTDNVIRECMTHKLN